ncbi:MAG: D-glycero-beta-D-manno-heptose-7-phosphate kinase [Nitrospirota bacterium]
MNYSKILNEFKKKKILVIGDLILDHYIWGKVSRISPEAPVPIVEVTDENFFLGGACNVANNIASLGGQTSVIGVVGSDRTGEIVIKMLKEKAIECSGVIYNEKPTTVKTRVIAHNQQVVRFDREDRQKIEEEVFRILADDIRKQMLRCDAIIISDYKKGVISRRLITEVLRYSKPKKMFVAVDPKVGHFHFYKSVSLITPNINEASATSGIDINDERSLIRAGKSLLKKISCEAVLLTRGEHGMSLFRGNKVVNIPTVARNVYDVTGAGDTVIAAFTIAHASGASMEEAAVIANHAAGIVVGEIGTAVVTLDQLHKSLRLNRGKSNTNIITKFRAPIIK